VTTSAHDRVLKHSGGRVDNTEGEYNWFLWTFPSTTFAWLEWN